MFERFTRAARQAVLEAVKAADELTGADKAGHGLVRPEHLLLGVAATRQEAGARVLAGFGLDEAAVRRAITRPDPRAVLSAAEMAALRAVGIDADEVFRRIEEAFGDTAWFLADAPEEPARRLFGRRGGRFGTDARRVLEQSLRQALALKHRHIGTEHILLGLLALPQPPLPDLLARHGVTYEQVRQRVLAALHPAA